MIITGTILEAETNTPIPFATVYAKSAAGVMGKGVITADDGSFTLNANNGDTVTAQIVGRDQVSKLIDAYGLTDKVFMLPMAAGANLAEATVTGQRTIKSKDIAWGKIGLGLLIITVAGILTKKYILTT